MLIRHCDACGKEVEDSGYYCLDVHNNGTNDDHPKHISFDICSECYNVALDALSCQSPALSSNIDRLARRAAWKPKLDNIDERIFKEEKLGIPNL